MYLEPISALPAIAQSMPPAPVAPPTGFGNWFSDQLSSVNAKLVATDHDAQKMAVGGVQNLHEVMINMEDARLSFQLLAQVRNRLLEAYQEVMKQQV